MTRFRFIALVALLLALISCSRKKSASPSTSEAAIPPAAAENPPPQPLVGEVNAFMTGQLRIFIQQNGRLPKDFAEFSHARLDSLPRIPLGMKWAIDPATQEVKLVKE